jgi:hypothetical protein
MIDLYCERVTPGLWAEPVNAGTNVAFFLAAWAVWGLARRSGARSAGVVLVVALLVTMGIGSGLFHAFATPWARVADVLPILVFQLCYLWLYGRETIGLDRGYAGGFVAAFLVAAYFGRQFPDALNGSLTYAPAFALVWGLGLYHHRTQAHGRWDLFLAAGVFSLAVLFRTIDNAVCAMFPLGTHFIWHLLVPVVAYLSARAWLRARRPGRARRDRDSRPA